ncbi:ABC transporter permease subunit [Shewanella loihica]|uniref:Binding-protein-dependent transport systems inner membrane component n=1 Tax=Shewanella loihica (strain ATCC BAA-1088 / PV-4) TaxID=323850 RepID=A3QFW8_SHELP|nr:MULTISPECIES: ABC transporter permease subunit [Shewanella]ABO24366.1 binding-protein-dependent transport systems inner membrane component [Shewanella loihica PV-4]QYJ91345.1 ABC transporter permease subunit [Shewanella halotolerans]QYJ96432.1 ABC transporter permease subunit [Shewanella alkalitolerans]QYK11680.1 ABC transporter permease subunit [Shewanella rhizosphaerae]TVP15242.1 peptide ABC transporter permease [Shewanella sp. KCT]
MPQIKIYQEDHIPSPLSRIWSAFTDNPFAFAGLWAVCCLLLLALFGPLIAPYSPEHQDPLALLLAPSWEPTGTVEHFLGTDDLGRDIFSRLLHGAHLTFGMALAIVITALLLGFIIGSISGMMKGLKSSILSHLLDALLSIPSLLMAILVVAVTGPGLGNVFWAVGIALTPQFVRAIHQAVHEELQKEYVTAARLDGANSLQIFWYVILPNIMDTMIIQTTLGISAAILDIAALGFLNLGAQAPSPEWGAMVSQGLDNLLTAPWTVTIPGVAILCSVLAINLVGDGLRSALSPIRS